MGAATSAMEDAMNCGGCSRKRDEFVRKETMPERLERTVPPSSADEPEIRRQYRKLGMERSHYGNGEIEKIEYVEAKPSVPFPWISSLIPGNNTEQDTAVQRGFKFGDQHSPGITITSENYVMTRNGAGYYRGGLVEPSFSTAGRNYIEFSIEKSDPSCLIMLGVTSLEQYPSDGLGLHDSPNSQMYWCYNAAAYCAGEHRDFGAPSDTHGEGTRVGLLVDKGRLFVYVNGMQAGGMMVASLPPQVRFAVDLARDGYQVRIMPGVQLPSEPFVRK